MKLIAICVVALVFGFMGSMPLAGPIAIMAVARASRGKYGEAMRIGLGAAVAEGLYAGFAFWGFTTFLARHAVVVPVSQAVTALVLTAIGVRFTFWKPAPHRDTRENKAGTALLGFSVSALNPTLLLTWSAAVAALYARGLQEPSPAYAIPFGLCAAAGIGGWFVVLSALFKRFGGKLPEAGITWVIRFMGMFLVFLAVWSAVKLVHSFA
jgi:threonine/homoserine/homoserine lactone efflux protein